MAEERTNEQIKQLLSVDFLTDNSAEGIMDTYKTTVGYVDELRSNSLKEKAMKEEIDRRWSELSGPGRFSLDYSRRTVAWFHKATDCEMTDLSQSDRKQIKDRFDKQFKDLNKLKIYLSEIDEALQKERTQNSLTPYHNLSMV